MTAKKKNEETTPDETVEETDETVEETTDEVVGEVTDETVEEDPNAKHATALFTGSLGGHVLLDSTTHPDGGMLMGAVIGTPPSGVPGASQFAALQHKQVG